MRRALLVILLNGCGGSSAPAPSPLPYGLDVQLALAQSMPAVDQMSVSTLTLHLTQLAAVSDRSSDDPRARKDFVDVDFGGTSDVPLPSAPPGTYSAVSFTLGDTMTAGIDLMGAVGALRLHLTLIGGPFDARCADPKSLEPGQRVRLTLSADATHWFDGVDLASGKNDEDDMGIIINMEDNAPLAIQIQKNAIKSFQLECATW